MALLLLLYITIMYLFPLLNVTGKRLVWLLNIFSLTSITFIVTSFSRMSSSRGDIFITLGSTRLVLGKVGLFYLVLRIFWRIWRRCPFMVACNFGRCFPTSLTVRPGHKLQKTVLMTLIHTDLIGLKTDL